MGRTLFCVLALFLGGRSNGEEIDQILFLHLKLKDDVVTLVNSSVQPGRLKRPPAPQKEGELQLELTAGRGKPLWVDSMGDPTVRRFEYQDPDRPGSMKVKTIRTSEAEFTIRVPFHRAAKQLEVYRVDRAARRTDKRVPEDQRKHLGTVLIPALGVVP